MGDLKRDAATDRAEADQDRADAATDRADALHRWQRFTMITISVVILLAGNVAYTTYVDSKRETAERESDRRWCELLVELDTAYSATPPQTEIGRNVARSVHELRVSLEC